MPFILSLFFLTPLYFLAYALIEGQGLWIENVARFYIGAGPLAVLLAGAGEEVHPYVLGCAALYSGFAFFTWMFGDTPLWFVAVATLIAIISLTSLISD